MHEYYKQYLRVKNILFWKIPDPVFKAEQELKCAIFLYTFVSKNYKLSLPNGTVFHCHTIAVEALAN